MKGFPTSFWGKLDKDESGAPRAWHPLADHCADVAACAEQLLRLPVLRRALAHLGELEDLSDVQVERLSFLAALHDVGKFNRGFQRKGSPTPRDTAGHVSELLALFTSGYPEEKALADALQCSRLEAWAEDPDVPLRLLIASISHHGRPGQLGVNPRPHLWRPEEGLAPFVGMASLFSQASSWFPRALESTPAPLPSTPAFQHAFSGLVTLADWLGSDRDFFPFRHEDDPPDRMSWARAQARRLVSRMGLDATSARAALGPRAPSFEKLFTFAPRAAQQLVTRLPVDAAGGITVLEAETGSGKTEAALARFASLFHAGAVDGMYFALPTRTAATQIHARVTRALERLFPHPDERPPVVLAVPGYLAVDDRQGVRLPAFEVLWNDSESTRWRFRGWAAEHPKRYLAGAVVVGTIDQVLLSALAVNHSHLRATALLRHLLVVDEVHASDTYMNRLLQEVLARHRKAGGHALLMSATLGTATRQRLLDTSGSTAVVPLAEACEAPYPAVSHAPTGGRLEVHATSTRERSKQVRVILREWMDASAQVAERALEAAARGARVIVLRNTVGDCIRTQSALEAQAGREQRTGLLFSCQGALAPHHARFAREDRTALDQALEQRFGKESETGVGCVVVATQTIQQSLDLDADLLLTDLCPMDVLLQRVGRLHRHQRTRPEGFEEAIVEVIVPAERSLTSFIRADGEARGAHGLGSTYEDLSILEATWRELEAHPLLSIPEMNRPLVERTTHPEALAAVVRSLGPEWTKHEQKLMGKTLARRNLAGLNLADWDEPFGETGSLFPDRELSEQVKTRLGEDDRLVSFTPPLTSPFGQQVARLTLPAWLARRLPEEELQPTDVRHEGASIHFTLGEQPFTYDRLGLRPAQASEEDDRA